MKRVILATLVFQLSGLALFADASGARAYFDAVSIPEPHAWLHAEMKKHEGPVLEEGAAIGLAGAAIEMVAKHKDLVSYNYLVTRLAFSGSDEEKLDIISKLTVWPGVREFAPTTLRVFEAVQRSVQSKEVLAALKRSIEVLDETKRR